jgi:hypothetical protein
MKHKLLILAGVLAVVAVLGGFYGKPVAAQIRGLLVQDVDQPARAPFQAEFELTWPPPGPAQAVTIPKGYRLVVDYVCAHGTAHSSLGGIQPSVVLTSPAGSSTEKYVLFVQQSTTVPDQFSGSWPVAVYADSLTVGPGLAGYTPDSYDFFVMISGNLVFVGRS